MNIIVTGGAGFIGSNFVYHMLKNLLPVSMQSLPCQTWVILG